MIPIIKKKKKRFFLTSYALSSLSRFSRARERIHSSKGDCPVADLSIDRSLPVDRQTRSKTRWKLAAVASIPVDPSLGFFRCNGKRTSLVFLALFRQHLFISSSSSLRGTIAHLINFIPYDSFRCFFDSI